MNRDFRSADNRPRETRVNDRVRAREVRLIDEEGQMIGVMTSAQALGLARERDLDLVEISPMAVPPVCKLMDYGRFKYDQAKRENEARKHQKIIELKEIRMTPRTDDHDISVKVRKIEEFLADGDKVKVSVKFRGREMAHPELGRGVLERIAAELKGSAILERTPIMEGKLISMIVARAPGWEPPKHAAPVPRARRGEHGAETTAEAPATPPTAATPVEAPVAAAPAATTPAPVAVAAAAPAEAPTAAAAPVAAASAATAAATAPTAAAAALEAPSAAAPTAPATPVASERTTKPATRTTTRRAKVAAEQPASTPPAAPEQTEAPSA